jgi:hypothetical protein
MPPPEQVDLAVEVFWMLSDSTRVRLPWALLDCERAVNKLGRRWRRRRRVSQHLARLRTARLVQTRHPQLGKLRSAGQ